MSKYQVIDNALDEEYIKHLENIFYNTDFPWYFTNLVTKQKETPPSDKLYWYKFYHLFYRNNVPISNYFDSLQPFLKVLNVKSLVCCRAFLTTYTGQKVNYGFHTDMEDIFKADDIDKKIKVSVFYLNTNNGGTMFESGEFVESVRNRIVTFGIEESHAAVSTDNQSSRIVINFNYF